MSSTVGLHPEQPAVVLQHVHPGAPVRRVHHRVEDAAGGDDRRERGEARTWVGQVVEHPRAHDVVESLAEAGDLFDREPMQFDVGEVVTIDEATGLVDAALAHVDPHHVGAGVPDGVLGGLRRAAPCDEDRSIVETRAFRPQPEGLHPSTLVGPRTAIPLEVVDRRWIRVSFVEGCDLVAVRHARHPFGKMVDQSSRMLI